MLIRRLAGLSAMLLLAACGAEKNVENQQAAPVSSTETPAAPRAPSPEFAALPPPWSEADYATGRRLWKLCGSCHLTAEGAGDLVGPNLHGLFGRQVASLDSFPYSPALRAEAWPWTPERLDAWLADPRGFVPGNRMSFAGLRKPEERTAVIAYLMVETGYTRPAE